MTELEALTYFAAPSIVVAFGIILILIAQIFTPEYVEKEPTILHVAQHLPAPVSDDGDLTFELTVDLYDMESYPQMGRRGVASIVRQQRVTDDWYPPIASVRIALLETMTAEYLFVRKPKDQLDTTRTQYVYSS